MQLLVISDASPASQLVLERLKAARVSTRVASPDIGAEAATFADEDLDGVVIDAGDLRRGALPLLRSIRGHGSKLPLLVLAPASAETEAEAFNHGADAVLPRNAPAATLMARIEAVRRRSPVRKANLVRCGNVAIDRDSDSLTVNGAAVEVTPCELRVLDMLLAARGAILGKERICEALHEGDSDAHASVLRVFVCRLRRKLMTSGADDIIRTVWGVGYRVEAPAAANRAAKPAA